MKSIVLGASGYAGAELLRILAQHPNIDVIRAAASGHAGRSIAQLYPSLFPAYQNTFFTSVDAVVDELRSGELKADIVFLALPNGVGQSIVSKLYGKTSLLVDLSADFRLKDPEAYPKWYAREHDDPALLAKAVYGLPELSREGLVGARLIACAGCYVTGATLPLSPLLRAGLIEESGIIIDAASGVSGAGRSIKAEYLFGEVNENFSAYGIKSHRHTPEIEQNLKAQILFTPHLLPVSRGILATTYSRPSPTFERAVSVGLDREEAGTQLVRDALASAYAHEPFVFDIDRPPSIKATLGSNNAMVYATYDSRTDTIITVSALDNLVKGASGQAVQCANIALGLPEGSGLLAPGLYP